MIITSDEFTSWDKRFRTNVLNKLSGYKSAHLIGTKNATGVSNLATINSVIHVGANPFLLGYLCRPLVVERHSYNNILSSGYFSLNQIHEGIIKQAHQCSAKYPEGVSEFEKVGLTEYYLPQSEVPCVKESHIKMVLKLQEVVPITSNNTLFIIGQVLQFEIPDGSINKEGHISQDTLNTVAINGLDSYYSCKHLATLPYAKP